MRQLVSTWNTGMPDCARSARRSRPAARPARRGRVRCNALVCQRITIGLENGIHARLPARALRTEPAQHVSVDAQCDLFLAFRQGKAAMRNCICPVRRCGSRSIRGESNFRILHGRQFHPVGPALNAFGNATSTHWIHGFPPFLHGVVPSAHGFNCICILDMRSEPTGTRGRDARCSVDSLLHDVGEHLGRLCALGARHVEMGDGADHAV